MNYIIFDMEWNAPLAGRTHIMNPCRLQGEIIQIGAVKTDENLKELDTFNVFIKPQYYTKMNDRVAEVTQITDEMLEAGIPFTEAMDAFKNFCGNDSILFTWGNADLDMILNNLEFYAMDESWLPEDFDAQLMFDDLVTMEGRDFSLDYARYTFDIKGLDAHDALNDALNTAEVMRHMEVADWLEEERAYRQECEQEEAE